MSPLGQARDAVTVAKSLEPANKDAMSRLISAITDNQMQVHDSQNAGSTSAREQKRSKKKVL